MPSKMLNRKDLKDLEESFFEVLEVFAVWL
jgi:hypothetical protein